MKSVHEVCQLSGVSRRTLQYYDKIGLLKPCSVTEAGYRRYDDADMLRLWLILFYKELGFTLKDIHVILDYPKERSKHLMEEQKHIIQVRQEQFQNMIHTIDHILKGDFSIVMLQDFNRDKIETIKKEYTKYAEKRTENCDSTFSGFPSHPIKGKLHRVTEKSTFSVTKIASDKCNYDLNTIRTRGEEICKMFQKAMPEGPKSDAARKAVRELRVYLLPLLQCDESEIPDIEKAYLDEKEKLDQNMPDLAKFINAAIANTLK